MQPVQEAERSKVDPECLVMKVMHNGPSEEVKSAVDRRGLDEFDGEKCPPSENVDFEELGGKGDGDDVGH